MQNKGKEVFLHTARSDVRSSLPGAITNANRVSGSGQDGETEMCWVYHVHRRPAWPVAVPLWIAGVWEGNQEAASYVCQFFISNQGIHFLLQSETQYLSPSMATSFPTSIDSFLPLFSFIYLCVFLWLSSILHFHLVLVILTTFSWFDPEAWKNSIPIL